jgi:hypothetical protein
MPHYIIKIKDRYLEWSTIVDAPVTYGMTLDELKSYIKSEYGTQGLADLPNRLKRVEGTGTSSFVSTLQNTLDGNRAGENETTLTIDEIYQKYCVDTK